MSAKTKKPLRLLFLLVSIVAGIVLVVVLGWKIFMYFTVKQVHAVPLKSLSLAKDDSGSYHGIYEISPVKVQVEVKLEEGKIADIQIVKHVNGFGGPAEQITQEVILKQSLDVDGISGATISSKCILKAIEDALEQTQENK